MGTRSKAAKEMAASRGHPEEEVVQVTRKCQEPDRGAVTGKVTEITEVKIKQELIDSNLPPGLTETDTPTDPIDLDLVEHEQADYVRNLASSSTVQSTVSRGAGRTYGVVDKRSLVQGKRRLPAASSRKRSKKYFQDIRLYAKAVSLGHNTSTYGTNYTFDEQDDIDKETFDTNQNSGSNQRSTPQRIQEDISGNITSSHLKDGDDDAVNSVTEVGDQYGRKQSKQPPLEINDSTEGTKDAFDEDSIHSTDVTKKEQDTLSRLSQEREEAVKYRATVDGSHYPHEQSKSPPLDNRNNTEGIVVTVDDDHSVHFQNGTETETETIDVTGDDSNTDGSAEGADEIDSKDDDVLMNDIYDMHGHLSASMAQKTSARATAAVNKSSRVETHRSNSTASEIESSTKITSQSLLGDISDMESSDSSFSESISDDEDIPMKDSEDQVGAQLGTTTSTKHTSWQGRSRTSAVPDNQITGGQTVLNSSILPARGNG